MRDEEEEEKMAGEGCEDAGESLSHRAEVFRSKLIEGFQIMDCVTEEGREKAPVYNSSDVSSTEIMQFILHNPHNITATASQPKMSGVHQSSKLHYKTNHFVGSKIGKKMSWTN